MGWKILIPQQIMSEGRQLLIDNGHTIIDGRGFEAEDVLADMKEYQPDAMIVRITKISREVIEADPNLKVIARHGAGFDSVDIQACRDNHVQLLYAPIANSTSVAETALMLMLECSRNVVNLRDILNGDSYTSDFRAAYYRAKLKVNKTTLNGKTVGIVGCGNIGSRLARRCLAMEMNVMCYDPFKPAVDFPDGVEVVRDLDRIFKESDYVSMHTPATAVTEKMVNASRLAMMKPTAFLINTSRGAVVDENALYEACLNHKIAGAGLDAISKEPMSPDFPLRHLKNVIIYPHIGGSTTEASHRASYCAAVGIQEAYDGKTPTWPVPFIDYETAPIYNDVRKPQTHNVGMFADIDKIIGR